MSLDLIAIFDAMQSHALASGHFERVNGHEPKSAPGNGLTAAVWVDDIAPVPAGSGLATSCARVLVKLRTYLPMLTENPDRIDPTMLAAVDALMRAYSGDFTLDGLARNIDLLGQAGEPLRARAGYITIDHKPFRVMDLNVPIIVNDLWEQAA